MTTYTDTARIIEFIPGLGIDDTDAFDIIVKRAERDIDIVLTVGTIGAGPDGLKIDPADLMSWQAERLSNAVAAQVEYRIEMGPQFFVRDQYQSVNGPDFSTTGKLSWLAPSAITELYGTGLATGLPSPDGAAPIPATGPTAGSWTRTSL